jgi:uncharacterized SAM-binding protein YcdF (DUF218 family)
MASCALMLDELLASTIGQVFAVVATSLAILSAPELPGIEGIGRWLTRVDQLPQRASYIVLFWGDAEDRADKVAELFREGIAPKVISVRQEIGIETDRGPSTRVVDLAPDVLAEVGIPRSAVEVIGETAPKSTYEEATLLRRFWEADPARPTQLVVVTSWYHTARVGWTLEQVFHGTAVSVIVVAAQLRDVDASAWWRSDRGIRCVVSEYGKWLFYVLAYS